MSSGTQTIDTSFGSRARKTLPVWAGVVIFWAVANSTLPNGAPFPIVVQGVILGTVTALMAMGLILLYRTSHVINFAYASMGGVGGMLSVMLYVEAGWPYPLAVVAGIATGIAVGAVVDLLVIRRFANASRLVLTVATIGLAQFLGGIELLIPRFFGSAGLIGGFETPLSAIGFNLEPVRVNGNHLLIVAAVPLTIAALAWFLLGTDSGVAVRAAAQNRERALLLGIPINRLTTLVWIIAGGLAALTAILKAPFAGAFSTALAGPTLLLPALAAAILARMESLPKAFLAGTFLGVVEQVVFWNTGRGSTIDAAWLAVILAGLFLQRKSLTRAEESGEGTWSLSDVVRPIPPELRSLPNVRLARWGGLAAMVFLAIWVPTQLRPSLVFALAVAAVWGVVVISLVVLTGWGGNVSLGQFAMVGMGAVVAGNVAFRYNLDLFVTLALAAVAGGLIALIIGMPALRIPGLFLAAATLAFAVALDSFFLNPNNFPGLIPGTVNRPMLWGVFDLNGGLPMYYLCLAFLALAIFIARSIRRSRAGRVLIATRDNRRAAAASAVPLTGVRLSGFVLSGILCGVAGGLYVFILRGAGVGTFQPAMSLEVFTTGVIGGLGSIAGALSGVFLFQLLQRVLTGELRLIVTGVGLLVVLMIVPGGLTQIIMGTRNRWLRRVASKRNIDVPSLFADRRVDERGPDADAISQALLEAPPVEQGAEEGAAEGAEPAVEKEPV